MGCPARVLRAAGQQEWAAKQYKKYRRDRAASSHQKSPLYMAQVHLESMSVVPDVRVESIMPTNSPLVTKKLRVSIAPSWDGGAGLRDLTVAAHPEEEPLLQEPVEPMILRDLFAGQVMAASGL